MATPPNATAPRNDAFGGGTLTPASNPVAVGGTFGGAGAASAPPNVGQPQILSARNNSGSNVRIPYARLVPMRGKQYGADATQWAAVPDINLRGGEGGPLSGRPIGQEYDGLESGELAWIMGRKFLGTGRTNGLPDGTPGADGASAAEGQVPWQAMTASAHGLGMGYGVDRMQRLAYTSWMEAYFRALFGNRPIVLNAISLSGPKQVYMSDELKKYAPYLTGASVLGSVDLPHTLNGLYQPTAAPATLQYQGAYDRTQPYVAGTNPAPVEAKDIRGGKELSGLASGLFVVEKGPFLRGKVISDEAVSMLAPDLSTPNRGNDIMHTVPRNLGDRLAFDALYAEMRASNFFDWSPDGMVLSKLESPSGEPLSSAELDARQAQLFNVCIQGPAIAKTWTGDPRMQCLPLDRVFIVMVADISSEVSGDGKSGAGATAELANAWDTYKEWVRPTAPGALPRAKARQGPVTAALNAASTAFANGDGKVAKAAGDYASAVDELFKAQALTVSGGTPAARQTASNNVTAARKTMDDFFGPLPANYDTDIAAAVKQGAKGIGKSVMTNFRLMRVTSSYLAATSACVVNSSGDVDPKSRCGMRIGVKGSTVTGEYIIGGWCIGTVIDSAASRASIGNMVKTAPASMAININVNVEWWSGDDLYKRYMDVDQTVYQRGQRAKWDDDTTFQKKVQAREAKLDVPEADLDEFKSWEPFKGA